MFLPQVFVSVKFSLFVGGPIIRNKCYTCWAFRIRTIIWALYTTLSNCYECQASSIRIFYTSYNLFQSMLVMIINEKINVIYMTVHCIYGLCISICKCIYFWLLHCTQDSWKTLSLFSSCPNNFDILEHLSLILCP